MDITEPPANWPFKLSEFPIIGEKPMNYFMLDGKKIPMSDETANALRRTQESPLDVPAQIADFYNTDYRGKRLILKSEGLQRTIQRLERNMAFDLDFVGIYWDRHNWQDMNRMDRGAGFYKNFKEIKL